MSAQAGAASDPHAQETCDGRPGTTLGQLLALGTLLRRLDDPEEEPDDTDPGAPHGIGVDSDR